MTVPAAHLAATGIAAPLSDAGPGLIAFLIVFAIGIALYFLVKSMNRNLAKIEVPYEDDVRRGEAVAPPEAGAAEDTGSDAEPRTNGTR